MLHFSQQNINEMHHLYRINLINSCSGYKSANLIGTRSTDGISNVAIFSSVTHLGSDPALMGFFLRPNTVPRNSYSNIKDTGIYTINHVFEDNFEESHHTSAKYDPSISEFDYTQLEEEYKLNFKAPFVKNSPVQMAMNFVEEYVIKANNTLLIVGEIQHLLVENQMLEKDGFLNLSKGRTMAVNGLDGYCLPQLKMRLDYQRPR